MKKLLLCMFAVSLTLLSACGGGDGGGNDEPKITSFSTNKSSTQPGTEVNLTPVFSNGTGTIDNGVGQVTSGISILATPNSTTTYTLTVKNSDGKSATKAITVTVDKPDPLEKLIGTVRFDYTMGSFLFRDSVNFSNVSIDVDVGKYLLDSTTNTACSLFSSPVFEYICIKINNSGSKDIFVFDMTSNTKGAGEYEFCRSSESSSQCALGIIMSPDGDVEVTVISGSSNRKLELTTPINLEYIYTDVEIYKQGSNMDTYSDNIHLNSNDEKFLNTINEHIGKVQQINQHNREE